MTDHWMERLPAFRGEVFVDGPPVEIAGLDFGKVRSMPPRVVIRPADAEDVVLAVRFCRAEGVALAGRGAGHSAGGQMLAPGGVVLDLKSLDRVLAFGEGWVDVEGGMMWRAVLEATIERGLTPPIVTDWLGVTVGGTLAMGGFGFMSFRRGTQMDQLLELDVVTGEGELVTCSPSQNPELFDVVRGTHGQFGLIVRARLTVEPAPEAVRLTQCTYGTMRGMLRDFMRLTQTTGTDLIHAFAAEKTEASICTKMNSTDKLDLDPQAVTEALNTIEGPWVYNLEVVEALGPGQRDPLPDHRGTLGHFRGLIDSWTLSWSEFCLRLPPLILEEQFKGAAPHPELTVFLPFKHAADFLDAEFQRLRPEEDLGNGPVLFFPIDRRLVKPSLFLLPENDTHCLFWGLLRRADPPTEARIAEQMADNEEIYRRAVQLGSVRYCCDTLPHTPAFWRSHYGSLWPRLQALKAKYDPDGILRSSWSKGAPLVGGGR